MEKVLDALRDRVLLFDGAMGTEIQKLELPAHAYPDGQAGFNDGLSLTVPDHIAAIHRRYLDAGADCIETNTFGSSKLKLDEYHMGDNTYELNKTAAGIAVDAVSTYDNRYVIGTMGPTSFLPSSLEEGLGDVPLDDIEESYRIQAGGLADGSRCHIGGDGQRPAGDEVGGLGGKADGFADHDQRDISTVRQDAAWDAG